MARTQISWTSNEAYEFLLFVVVTGYMLSPVFAQQVFFTHDGAAHLYNSQIIKAFMTGEGDVYRDFFRINAFPEPNWTGHALLVFLLFFVKPMVAEKILVSVYIVGFCLGFWYWVKSFGPKPSIAVFLIFPFVYSFPLYVGFFNFCLGLSLLFFISGYWIRHAKGAGWGRGVVLFALFVLAYFTHITTFMVTLFFVGCYTLYDVWENRKNDVRTLWMYRVPFLAILPVMLFSVTFFLNRKSVDAVQANHLSDKWKNLLDVSPLTVFDVGEEVSFSTRIGLILGILAVIGLVGLFFVFSKNDRGKHRVAYGGGPELIGLGNVNLLLALSVLLLYFLLPNEMASGGFVSVRLLLLFFIALVAWLSTLNVSPKLLLPFVVIVLVTTTHVLAYRNDWAKIQNRFVAGLTEVAPHVPEGSVVMPLVESEHWFFLHASNYLGALRPVIMLDNYEAETGYFPVVWKPSPSPGVYFGEPIFQVCGEQFLSMQDNIRRADIILCYSDSTAYTHKACAVSMREVIEKDFQQFRRSFDGRWRLFRRKGPGE